MGKGIEAVKKGQWKGKGEVIVEFGLVYGLGKGVRSEANGIEGKGMD